MIRLLWHTLARQGKSMLGFPRLRGGGQAVAYDLADGDQQCYPQLLAPRRGTPIALPRRGKNCKRGLSESWLSFWMLRHRLKNFYDSTALHVPGHRFEPDLAYVDEARGIFIDIEVDEPYTFARRIPTHAMGRDDERNRLVTEAGWVVLRFSEQQALTTPERVARTVIDVVRTIAPDVPMPRALRDVEPAVPEPRWDYQEARRRAATRASYTYQRRNILYRLMNLCRPK